MHVSENANGRGGSTGGLGRKRGRDDDIPAKRSNKRVTFCNRDFILGTAPSYDRTSSPGPVDAAFLGTRTTYRTGAYVSKANPPRKANFCGIWRRSHGFNWAALLELSGVDKAAIPAQVYSDSSP